MTRSDIHEFLVTILAIMFGLIAGKIISQLIGKTGVPISSNDPLIISLPPTATPIPSPLPTVGAQNTVAAMNSAAGN